MHWVGHLPRRFGAVRCGAGALHCLGMYGERVYTLLFYTPQPANGRCALYSIFFFSLIPLSSIMYDSSHGAALFFWFRTSSWNIIIKSRGHRAWIGGGNWALGCWGEGKERGLGAY